MEQLAVIKRPKFGYVEWPTVALSFVTKIDEGTAAQQIIGDLEMVHDIFLDAKVDDVAKLDGMTCWIKREGNVIRFIRMAII